MDPVNVTDSLHERQLSAGPHPIPFKYMHTVLVVDDETDILDLVSFNLQRQGLTVLTAENGIEAVRIAKDLGCTVIATAGDDEKCAKAKALGADHVVNYSTQNFPTVARRVTGKRGVDVVFEHVGASTWSGSLLSLKMGGRLVTCGSTSGVSAETNLMMLFQRQLRIFGSFGASMRNIADGYAKMARGILPVLHTVVPLERFAEGLERLESRRVFGKIVVTL
jgi:NADPH:quinone reductase-like Zn-dependent oxidoreductase